ncbi:NAD(P)/FAD-dependent oxidoreductase [Actinoplanes sp. L3-i22]|uniref:flavin monoamine oxidase family protein n=1 Tax=Actinoplanes sp. L3-i22 TaxID=2836373 RepID=UPI001C84DD54|nr:NAD(P)/FAD-dependent oxidoreductase [Actinoplanes sp. L3-i22]
MSIKARLLGSAVSHWGADPWARGSWSLIGRHGTPQDRIALGTPVGDRLRIAGEATHPTRAGMTHGAYEQGLAAAAWAIERGHPGVLVVGAGMAGLAAARALAERGVQVRIREARDRIGGRTAGVDVAGGAFDLGANWLQQYDDNVLARLAERLGLTTVVTDFTDPLVLNAHPIPHGIEDDLRDRLAAAGPQASVADVLGDWLRAPAPWTPDQIHRLADAEIVMDAGVPLTWLSARHGFEPGVGEGDRWIVGGYRLLTAHLAAGLDIRLGRPVDRIDVQPGTVVVSGGEVREAADAVIVTVPLPVLAAGAITFDPPLPESHRTALSHLGAGRVEKVILRFDRRFWPEHGYYRVHGPAENCISEWLDATAADGTPTLVGLFAGPWQDTLWTGSDDEIAARATEIIRAAAEPW